MPLAPEDPEVEFPAPPPDPDVDDPDVDVDVAVRDPVVAEVATLEEPSIGPHPIHAATAPTRHPRWRILFMTAPRNGERPRMATNDQLRRDRFSVELRSLSSVRALR
jgi:hypothetical protein